MALPNVGVQHTLTFCAPHAHPLLPTAMAFVPHGFVLVEVEVQMWVRFHHMFALTLPKASLEEDGADMTPPDVGLTPPNPVAMTLNARIILPKARQR
jgi:hypothetical protein